jgi:hypothetical protein
VSVDDGSLGRKKKPLSVDDGNLGRKKKKKEKRKRGPVRRGPETSISGPGYQDLGFRTSRMDALSDS